MGFFQDDKGKIGLEPIDKGRRMPNRGKQPHGNGRMAPLRSWKASQYYTERFRALLSVFYYGDLSNFNVNSFYNKFPSDQQLAVSLYKHAGS